MCSRNARVVGTHLVSRYLSFIFMHPPISCINMQRAIAYKHEHPEETYSAVANQFSVAPTTLYNCCRGVHAAPGIHGPRHLSIEQEAALLAKINAYATRGTLLTPKHVRQLAQALSEEHSPEVTFVAIGHPPSSGGTRLQSARNSTGYRRWQG